MQQIPCAGIEMEGRLGFSERPYRALQFFGKRAAKDVRARSQS
jgi:hypothetical protein